MSTKSIGAGAKGLRPCKRYITTNDSNGRSVYVESPAQEFTPQTDMGGIARSYAVSSVPAKLDDEADISAYRSKEGPTSYKRRKIVLPVPGVSLGVTDFAPGGTSPWHRTVSIDYSICVDGELDHELDGGEKVRLYPGDHIVQRATMHRWSNPSQEKPARLVACITPCMPFDIAGSPSKEEFAATLRSRL